MASTHSNRAPRLQPVGAYRALKVATRVATLPVNLMVTRTVSNLPFAFAGSVRLSDAVPSASQTSCGSAVPSMVVSPVVPPTLLSGTPFSLRVTGIVIDNRMPAAVCAGQITGLPIADVLLGGLIHEYRAAA